jgi:tRNA pseudouridine55 synthase
MNGIIVINKEPGFTSRDMVNKVGKILGTKKIGHTGTLDPMATGVLVMCIGKCTSLVDIITCDFKEYIAGVRLGIMTDTLDTTGVIIDRRECIFTKDDIVKVLDSMVGEYYQEVPKYSAVKINGKKLYEYARENICVELPKRLVDIKSIELLSDVVCHDGYVDFSIKCVVSKGTYIRSLIRDIALRLNTIGVMSSLVRTRQGKFSIDDSYNIDDILKGNYKFVDLGTFFSDKYKVIVDGDLKKSILNGSLLKNSYGVEEVLFVDGDGLILALYRVYDKDKSLIKPYKMFGGIK